jgi:hypothetical protein
MRFRLDALFTAIDPVVAVYPSRHDADASLAALRRAGYGRGMLTVVGQSGPTRDVDGATKSLGPCTRHWAASGTFWGMLWTAFIVASVFLLPAGTTAFATLMTMGVLALMVQTAIVARVVAPERDGPDGIAAAPPRQTASDRGATPWRFLIVVRGSRSDIALARAILAAH